MKISIPKKRGFLLIIVIVIVVLLSLLPPQILKRIIDDYLLTGKKEGLLAIGIIYLSVYFFIGVFDFVKNYLLTIIGQGIVRDLRCAMSKKMSHLKSLYFVSNGGGKITSKFINDTENISTMFTDGISGMAVDCFKIIGIVASMWIFDWHLGVFALCLVPVIVIITRVFRKIILKAQNANLQQLGSVNGHLSDTIKNIFMIKSFNKEKYMEEKYEKNLESNYCTMKKISYFDSSYSPVIQMVTALSTAFILYLAIGGNGDLSISIGMVTGSVNYITNLFQPIDSLGMEIQNIQKGLSGIESVKDFLEQEEESKKEPIEHMDFSKSTDIITLENVDFGYNKKKYILKNANMWVKKGENLVITGRTGEGKTTIFKLITGVLSPDSGSVEICGISADKIPNEIKREIFGYVEQNFAFIEGNIIDQITLGDKNISREEAIRAIDFVGLKEYIQGLSDLESKTRGFDVAVRGEMFSQGQKQLLAMARALAGNPKILLFDEVTANLDSITENKVLQVLKKAGTGRTIISIAHRESTINGGDRIVKIMNGKIE